MLTTVGEARRLATALLRGAAMPVRPAESTAWALVAAELWGRPSHGLLRLPYYLERLAAGGTNPVARLRLVRRSTSTTVLDGQNGLGHWQLAEAARRAATMARRGGLGAVSVANSGHCGVLGLYVRSLAADGLVAIACSNGPAAMAPVGGHRPVLSTSPIAVGVPTVPNPAVVDLATSAASRGAIAAAAARGESIPAGWALDATGRPTTDPRSALAGMLAPLAGAKGFALGFAVEAMTGAMTGPSLSVDVADPLDPRQAAEPQRISHFVLAIDPARFDFDGQAPARFERLVAQVRDAGGRLPGAGHPDPDAVDPASPLEIADELAHRLERLAAAGSGPRRRRS